MTDERSKREHRLVNGVFSPEDASTMLMNLLEDKINFHRRNIWSRKERFGETDLASEKRIQELQQTKADISKLLEDAAADGAKLAIHCDIDITRTGS
jgi:hypothetical protein